MTIHIGITGTREGCTRSQWLRLAEELRNGRNRDAVLHHGDCIGVDADAHELATAYGYRIEVHPPTNGKYRARCNGHVLWAPKPYMERNADIVREVKLLIVVPSGPEADNPRSGTWATYRMAVKAGVETVVIEP